MTHQPIHAMFRSAAERFGGHTAVEWGDRRATYRELDEWSDETAVRLLEAGLERNAPVAILAARTVDAIASVLGVLKAGGAFVPFDPGSPTARFEAAVEAVRPRWWLADPNLTAPLEALRGQGFEAAVLPPEAACSGRVPPPAELNPEGMAYVYFTSGSTGRPKAIAGRLKAIDHFIRWETETFGISEGARVSQLTSPAFDAWLRDAFVPLAVGGTVCAPARRETVLGGAGLVEWIHRSSLTLVHCTPSLFRSLLAQELEPSFFPALSHVLLAGEPLLPSDVRRWRDVFGDRIELVNLYGPSETTMIKLFHRVRAEDAAAQSVPVGQPIAGTKALVVDDKGQPCPPGKLGEIYIRTPYRALGYLGQPELTREVFIPNPFSHRPDDLVYKTGDLGRIRKDGVFEVIGRRDLQVKIRGVRVEMGSIEDLLFTHEAVAEAAVVDRTDTQGNKYLCAYLVLRRPFETGLLLDFLRERLPETMIPSVLVPLDSLPRTLSGKVDRRALPDPGQTVREHTPPQNPVEEKLCALFAELLEVPRIGTGDSFFELGGHSLLATLLLSRIRAELGVEVPLHLVFRAPTVRDLAAAVARKQGEPAGGEAAATAGGDGRFPLSPQQQRLWLVDELERGSAFYNIAAAAVLAGELREDVLRAALAEVVRRHEALRTVFPEVGGQPAQAVLPPFPPELPRVDLTALPAPEREGEARRLAAVTATVPFDLARGPLLRCLLLRLTPRQSVLVCALHHIVADWWSLGILVGELATAYGAFRRGTQAALPLLPVQYRHFATEEGRRLAGEADAQLTYWRRQLAGAPIFLPLPHDFLRPAVQTFRGAAIESRFATDLSQGLRDLALREGCTLFVLLLSAFLVVLAHATGLRDLVVSAPVSGRYRPEVQGLIGFFVRTLLFRGDLSGNPPFREVLARVRHVVLDAYEHQDLPLERLIEELARERTLSYTPLMQVGMNLIQQEALAERTVDDLTVSPFPFDTGTVQHELNLIVAESSEGLIGRLQYKTSLFHAETVALLADQLRGVLEHILQEPGVALSVLAEGMSARAAARRLEGREALDRGSLRGLLERRRPAVRSEVVS